MKSTGINKIINSVAPAQGEVRQATRFTVYLLPSTRLDSRLRGNDNRGEAE